jgi:hypothetical protein
MECVQNLLLGDPVYDERGQLVRREFGLKNALALLVLGYIAHTLYCSMGKKVFSGKRKGKMKGGGGGSSGHVSESAAPRAANQVAIEPWKKFLMKTSGGFFIPFFVLIVILVLGDNSTFVKGNMFAWLMAISGAGVAIPLFILFLYGVIKGSWNSV